MEQHEVEVAYRTVAAEADRYLNLLRRVPVIVPIAEVGGGSLGLVRVGTNVDPVWLSLISVPLHAAGDLIQVNETERVFYRGAVHRADNDSSTIMSVDTHGLSADFADDGRLRYRMRLYRSGVLEWGAPAAFWGEPHQISPVGLCPHLITRLGPFGEVYDHVGYRGPIRLLFSVDNLASAELLIDPTLGRHLDPPARPAQVQYLWDASVDRLLTPGVDEIRPALDRLWQAFGYPSAHDRYLTESAYVGQR
jgi:hypothetical protein